MFKSLFLVTIVTIFLLISGCSSSSDDSTLPIVKNLINGTVATGAGASATITLVGARGNTVVGNSSSAGLYTVDVSDLTKPIMIRAVLDRDGSTLYSFTSGTSAVVNVTPLTTYVVDNAAVSTGSNGGASQMFSAFEQSNAPASIAQEVTQSVQILDQVISATMEAHGSGGFDHFGGNFEANHDGYDAVLDDLDIEIYEDDIIIRVDDLILDTLNYDISTNEINASGIIFDIQTQIPILNASITMVDSAGNTISTVSDVNGSFSLTVETMRVYDITVVASGYETQFVPSIPSFVFSETSVGNIPMFPENSSSITTLSGTVIDGRTSNTGISGVTLTFRDGFGERISSSELQVVTDSDGSYSIEVPTGIYSVALSHPEYYNTFNDIAAFGDTSSEDFSMLSDLSGAEVTDFFATITLNWDENPRDLDSHLTGPIPNSTERFHMAYYNQVILAEGSGLVYEEGEYEYENRTPCQNGELASLDRDRTDSYTGLLPETTTICNVQNGGLYKYYVHHYSGENTMSYGNAEVTVSTKNGTPRTFSAPSIASVGDHDIWHVFNIDSDGNIFPINEIIGNGDDGSSLFAAPSRNSNTKFSSDKNLLDYLPVK